MISLLISNRNHEGIYFALDSSVIRQQYTYISYNMAINESSNICIYRALWFNSLFEILDLVVIRRFSVQST